MCVTTCVNNCKRLKVSNFVLPDVLPLVEEDGDEGDGEDGHGANDNQPGPEEDSDESGEDDVDANQTEPALQSKLTKSFRVG